METRQVVALSMLAGVAFAALAVQAALAEDKYIKTVPLDAWIVPTPVPVIPQGSTLDLRPARIPDAGDQMKGYRPGGDEGTTPSIGLSIKAPVGK